MGGNLIFSLHFKFTVTVINYSFLIKHIFIKHLLCLRRCSRYKGCNDELNKDPALMELVFLLVKSNITYIYIHTHMYTHIMLWATSVKENGSRGHSMKKMTYLV